MPNHNLNVTVVEGDLLDQDVDVIVNAWNRNIIPWWLLLPQGVSGAIKKRGGTGPFKELAKIWRASERSIRDSVRNAIKVADDHDFKSIAFPLIGAGSGSFNQDKAKQMMLDEIQILESYLEVTVVEFKQAT